MGSTEAMWRIYELSIHFQSHTIIRLDIHLQQKQNIILRKGQERQAVGNPKLTRLLAFFQLNQSDPSAVQKFHCILFGLMVENLGVKDNEEEIKLLL